MAEVLAWRMAGSPREDVEDAAASVWLKLVRDGGAGLRTYAGRNGATLATWLAKVASNAATDFLRRRRSNCVPLAAGTDGDDGRLVLADRLRDHADPDPLDKLVAREGRAIMRDAVRSLPPIYRAVILARFHHGWSAAETASRLGVAEPTVYVRSARALAKLRRELARRGLMPQAKGSSSSRAVGGLARHPPGHRHVGLTNLAALLGHDTDSNLMAGTGEASTAAARDSARAAECFPCWRELFGLAVARRLLELHLGGPGGLTSTDFED